jgi:phospholipid/cholesterol/gamma-HCH transport system substrate-binding protein
MPNNCEHGYESTDRRSPQNRGDRPMNFKAGCLDPSLNQRGAEKAPGPSGSAGRAPVATYDQKTGKLTWADQSPKPAGPTVAYDGGAAQVFGQDSWKWLILQPSVANQE